MSPRRKRAGRTKSQLRARQAILNAANREINALGHSTRHLTMRNLQEAVHIVRHGRRGGLVSALTLTTAGFNPIGGKS